jgi:Flp pilus assembly protein TadG
MRKWFQAWRTEEAAEIAEFAIVLPILFFLVLAMFWVGQTYNISNNLNKAATDGLAVALKNSCATCGNAAATNVQIADAIEKAFQAGNLKSGNLTSFSPTPACPSPITSVTSSSGVTYNVEVCTGLPLWPASTVQGTRVAMQYRTPISSPVGAFRNLTLTAVVQGRQES